MAGARIEGVLFGAADAGSFVSAGQRAFSRARLELGADVAMHWLDRQDVDWRIGQVRGLAQSRPDLIVLHGAQGEVIVERLSREFPDVAFALTQGDADAPNVASYEVLLEQPAFLAGALAGCVSRSGIIGHLSGERVRAGLKGRAAFAGGVRWARPDARFLSVFCGAQHDAPLAARQVSAQADAGADVVFTMLGAGREGAIDACRIRGIRQIGDGVDWCATHPEVFVAAVLADSAWASFQAIADFVGGRLCLGSKRTVGLEEPSICRLVIGKDVDASVRSRIAELTGNLLAGELSVPEYWSGEEFHECPAP